MYGRKLTRYLPHALLCLSLISFGAHTESGANITFHGTLLNTPLCYINDEKVIQISFGDAIAVGKIDDGIYKQPIPVDITCEDTNEKWQLKVTISGVAADFDAENATVVSKEFSDLGVKFFENGVALPLEQIIKVEENTNQITLDALLVKREGVDLQEGDFSASASLRAEYY